ncbi:respiratory nitrate reductase subunit gamma [Phenylobacterium sp.]|uniref:respiratory nitrate reductase subunit gamma n=1 Tax=Phenylobacterium sp. TaxID=1871053 RepID=UPI002737B527|nr:respiratory nitrate reductase subunit gamma [Phenylobacterium sp.]MDP3868004.1 respiratory nitrate reductase subunit gamma [Phenylobacterium sp.]
MQLLNQILFGVYPYIALAVLVLGSVIRFDREQYTWRSGSSQLLRRKQLVLGSVLFHVGVLVIFGGHFVGLLTPIWVFDALGVPHGAKQILAIVAGGIAGILCLAGGLLLLHRRLFDPRIRHNSSFGDTAILIILMVQLCLGLATIPLSLGHLDGGEMLKFMSWAQGVFAFQPNVADHVADVHPIFKAHLVLGMTILLVFPFTRLVHMLSAPVWYLNRRGWQLVRTRRPLPHRSDNAAPVYPTRPGVQPIPLSAKTAAVRPAPFKPAE